MKIHIRHGENKQSEAFARIHCIVSDQPSSEGGDDRGMTPPELMLSALRCCAMHYAAEYLKTRGLSPSDLQIQVSAQKGGVPVRLTDVEIDVQAAQLDARTTQGLLKSVEACLLHRTLLHPPHIRVSVCALATA